MIGRKAVGPPDPMIPGLRHGVTFFVPGRRIDVHGDIGERGGARAAPDGTGFPARLPGAGGITT